MQLDFDEAKKDPRMGIERVKWCHCSARYYLEAKKDPRMGIESGCMCVVDIFTEDNGSKERPKNGD